MKAFHQLATVEKMLSAYQQDQPLHRFLALYYRQNKQMGSKDRRTASRLMYNYFRLGDALKEIPLQDKLLVAEFLCNESTNSYISYYKPEWDDKVAFKLEEKLKEVTKVYSKFKLNDLFPFHKHISPSIHKEAFLKSLFVQPDLYIRVKRGSEKNVYKALIDAEIRFTQIKEQTFALPNGTKLDQLINNKEIYEVQDLSSQQTGAFFKPQKWDKWWDCCAASGGKTLLLYDEQPNVKLVVSDIRESILDNLEERFRIAGLRSYQKKVLDLTQSVALHLHDYAFDGIILDAPCSGSGTWGRTPEMISQFEAHSINFFQELQRKIIKNVIAYLKPGKPLIYITCSVFKEENEEQIDWIKKEFGFETENQQLIKGYEHKADTMFVARMIKQA